MNGNIIQLLVTDDELMMIRRALCQKSTRTLMHAHDVQDEERIKGLGNEVSEIYIREWRFIHALIDKIDLSIKE